MSFGRAVFASILALLAPFHLDAAHVVAQDTIVVRADNLPMWGARPGLVEEVRIGTVDGDERYVLGRVASVAVTSDGTIWVADAQLAAIRRYDRRGEHIDDVGGEGEGPGEFSSHLQSLRVLADGTVAAWDPGLRRISRFDAAGRYLASMQVPSNGVVGGIKPFEVDTAGHFYAISWTSVGSPPEVRIRSFWIRLAPDGEVLDSVRVAGSHIGGTVHAVREWSALSPHGYLVAGRNDEYALHRPLHDGRILRIERSWEPVRYEGAERAETQRLEDHFAERNGREPRRIPMAKPAWSDLDADAEGRVWVERYGVGFFAPETPGERDRRERYDNPPREWRHPIVYDVIEPRGRYLGTLRFPGFTTSMPNNRVEIALARGNLVWVVEHGEYDEQYVVRYRLEPG